MKPGGAVRSNMVTFDVTDESSNLSRATKGAKNMENTGKLGWWITGLKTNTMINILCLQERIGICSRKIRRRLGRIFYLFELLVDNSPLWCMAASGLLIGTLFATTSPILGSPNLTSDSMLVTGIIFIALCGIPLITKIYRMSKRFT